MRAHFSVFLIVAIIGQLFFAAAPASASTSPAKVQIWPQDDLESFVDGAVSQQFRQHHLAGAVVTIVKDGKVIFSKGYGYADLAAEVPMDPMTTGLRVGSVGKLVTWTAVMQLVAEGRIDLDADVNTYLTAFKIPATRSGPITMRHLMTHSAGFDDSARGFLFRLSPDDFQSLEQTLIEHMPPRIRDPGVVSSYSNYGAALAGYVVQKVGGLRFEDYVAQRIFSPLQMTRSTFVEPVPRSLSEGLAKGYYFSRGRLVEAPFEYIHNVAPAGAMTTTGDDMAKFMIAHLEGERGEEGSLLPLGAIQQMHKRTFAQDPRVPGVALGFYEWWTAGRRLLTHKGRTTYFATQVALLPEERFGVFVSFNAAEGGPAAEALIAHLVDRYFARPVAKKVLPGRVMPVEGTYRTSWHSERTFEKLFVFGGDVRVDRAADGSVSIRDARGVQRFEHFAPDYFVSASSGEPLVAKAMQDGRLWLFRGTPVSGLYRLAWYETSRFHLVLLVTCLIAFAAAGPMTLRSWLRLRTTGRATDLAILSALASGVVVCAFAATLAFVLGGPSSGLLTYNIPTTLRIIVWFPPVGLALLVTSIATSMIGCRHLLLRPAYLVLLAALAACIWSAAYWNLFGPRFG